MSVYFVLRSHYEGPAGKYVRRFDDASVLDWFRAHWGDGSGRAAAGTHVYGFDSLFEAIGEYNIPPPASSAALGAQLDEHLYVEGELLYTPHAVQVLTDDDELELAYYVFDDAYLEHNPSKAAFLLHEGVDLPPSHHETGGTVAARTEAIAPAGGDPGTVYAAFLAYYDSSNLTDLEGAYRVDGVRLPGLGAHLAAVEALESWPFELRLLRARLGAPDASLEAALGACARFPVAAVMNSIPTAELGVGDLRAAADGINAIEVDPRFARSGHDPAKSIVRAERHVAQLCLHTDRWGERDLYHRWILFDDLWAGAHPDLAAAILAYARQWDVLS
jgi:hypothetical protein